MNYSETCGYLKSLDSLGNVLGLDSIRELLKGSEIRIKK